MSAADPLNQIEAGNALTNLAELCRAFYNALLRAGFDEETSIRMAEIWLNNMTNLPAAE